LKRLLKAILIARLGKEYSSHRRASPIDHCLIGVFLIGVFLIGGSLIGGYLIGLSLIGALLTGAIS
jgi:hypothetical protein